jgi:hypothetical protein
MGIPRPRTAWNATREAAQGRPPQKTRDRHPVARDRGQHLSLLQRISCNHGVTWRCIPSRARAMQLCASTIMRGLLARLNSFRRDAPVGRLRDGWWARREAVKAGSSLLGFLLPLFSAPSKAKWNGSFLNYPSIVSASKGRHGGNCVFPIPPTQNLDGERLSFGENVRGFFACDYGVFDLIVG